MAITRLHNITGPDRIGIPVAIAARPNSRSAPAWQGQDCFTRTAPSFGIRGNGRIYRAFLNGMLEDGHEGRRVGRPEQLGCAP
jgi:hypothetical protein